MTNKHTPSASASSSSSYLLSPVLDFLAVGGLSLIFLLLIVLFIEDSESTAAIYAGFILVMTNLINHPHFMHSYQILYENFGQKLSTSYPSEMRIRYWWCGVAVPLIIIGFFLYCLWASNPYLLGFAVNVMFFTVGWHYAKQGYGILIVLSLKKGCFFSEREKKLLQLNAHSVWVTTWLIANGSMYGLSDYWGVEYWSFNIPAQAIWASLMIMFILGLSTIYEVVAGSIKRKKYPSLNGMVGYITALYLWMLFGAIHPVYILLIPAFHSLQYLPFVWRYKLNQYAERGKGRLSLHSYTKLLVFFAMATLVGVAAFWGIPALIDNRLHYNPLLFSTTLGVFMVWIFINVHHFFIDNVIWRKENPDVKKYLFGL